MTTAPVTDARPHSAAIKAAITGYLGGEHKAYDYDEVPGSPQNANEALRHEPLPDLFALVAVERRFTPYRRSTAQAGRSSWRISVRSVGRSIKEAQWVQDRVTDALDESRLSVSGAESTPLQHESSDAPTWSDGRYAATSIWIYTL